MSYIEAKEKYAKYGIDTEKAIDMLSKVSISVHCWQCAISPSTTSTEVRQWYQSVAPCCTMPTARLRVCGSSEGEGL